MRSVTKNRIIAFDVMETVAIIMACSLHYPLFQDGSFTAEIWQLLCMGAVPLFFAVNGVLLFSRPLDMRKHLRRIVKLVACILAWKSLILCYGFRAHIVSWETLTLQDYLNLYLTGGPFYGVPVEHFWFLYSLLAIYLVFPLMKIAYDSPHRKVLLYLLLVLLMVTPVLYDGSWLISAMGLLLGKQWSVDIAGISSSLNPLGTWGWYSFFFISGAFLWERVNEFQSERKSRKLVVLGVSLVILGVAIGLIQDRVYHGQWTWSGAVLPFQYQHIATVLVAFGMMMSLGLIRGLPSTLEHGVVECSKSTMFIFIFHMPLLHLLGLLIDYPVVGTLADIVRAVLVVAFLTVFAMGARRVPGLKELI